MDLFDELLVKRGHHGSKHHGHHDDHGCRDRQHGEGHEDDYGRVDRMRAYRERDVVRDADGESERAPWHRVWRRDRERGGYATTLLAQIMRNRAMLALAAILLLIVLVAAIGALMYLLPLMGKLLGFVGENGVKGVVDQAAPIIDKVWNGAAGK